MQDNAFSHGSKATKAALQEQGVTACFWPAFSPDLNPIESLWDLLKNWIADNYVMEDLKDYKVLRKALIEAWNSITKEQLDHLINSMQKRCQAVITANDRQTKY
jgi:transposase